MDVDRAGADGTAARQRHIGLPEARQQRSEHKDRGAHGLDEVVWCDRLTQSVRVDLDIHALIDGHRDAHPTEQLDHGGDILQVRHIADRHRLGGEQRRGEDRQSGVLGARHPDLALERGAARDLQLVHDDYAQAGRSRPASSGVNASMLRAWISRPTSSPRVR